MDMEMVCGRQPVREVLESRRTINKILIAKNAHLHDIVATARKNGVRVSIVERAILSAYGKNHQGVVAFISPKTYTKFEGLRISEDSLFVLLDRVQDPQNLGAIIRSCEFFGVDAVILPKKRSAKITKAVWKASAGAVEHMTVVLVSNLAKTIDALREKKVWIIGTDIDGERCCEKNLTGPVALIFGGEHAGMRRLVRKKCDLIVTIPGKGKISALNVSTAAGILLYEFIRQGDPKTI
jgi:23S rRNA (guanosine2251-2'-O)-methyltransferase